MQQRLAALVLLASASGAVAVFALVLYGLLSHDVHAITWAR